MSFENVALDNSMSDGSIADVEDDEIRTRPKTKKLVKKKKPSQDDVDDSSSDDDTDDDLNVVKQFTILTNNPHELSWPMWCWYQVVNASVTTFHAAEYCGEKLADFFGITSPKYQYVINEYHRLRQEELEEEEADRREVEYMRQRETEHIGQLESGASEQRVNTTIVS